MPLQQCFSLSALLAACMRACTLCVRLCVSRCGRVRFGDAHTSVCSLSVGVSKVLAGQGGRCVCRVLKGARRFQHSVAFSACLAGRIRQLQMPGSAEFVHLCVGAPTPRVPFFRAEFCISVGWRSVCSRGSSSSNPRQSVLFLSSRTSSLTPPRRRQPSRRFFSPVRAVVERRLHQDAQDRVDHPGVDPLPVWDAARLKHRQVRPRRDVRRPGRGGEAGG